MAKESSFSRRARVKLQLRDSEGRWIEMGGSVKWYSSKLKKNVSGIVTGTKGTNIHVKLNSAGVKSQTVSVPAHTVQNVHNKATLGEDPAVSGLIQGTNDMLDQAHQNASKSAASPIAGTPEDYKSAVTSDGLLYAGRKDDQELYSPASELEVGDTVMSPVGTDPTKPYSIGKNWNRRGVEAFDPDGPGIGEVVEVQEDSHVTVQLPEGDGTVTVGIENDVIKATPGLTEVFDNAKGASPDPVSGESEAGEANSAETEPEIPEIEDPEEPATGPEDVKAGIAAVTKAVKDAEAAGVKDEALAAVADENRFTFTGPGGKKFTVSPSRDFDGNWSLDLTNSSGEDKGTWSSKEYSDLDVVATEIHGAVNSGLDPDSAQPASEDKDFDKTMGGLYTEDGFSKEEQMQYDFTKKSLDKFGTEGAGEYLAQLEKIRDDRFALQKTAISASKAGEGLDLDQQFPPAIVPTPVSVFMPSTKINIGDKLLLARNGLPAIDFDSTANTSLPLEVHGSATVTGIQPLLGKNKTSMGKPVGVTVELQKADGTTVTQDIYQNSGGTSSKRGVFLDNEAFRKNMAEFLNQFNESKEETPDADTDLDAPSAEQPEAQIESPEEPEAAEVEDSAEFTEADAAKITELENQIASIYANKSEGDVEALESELDDLYAKQDASPEVAPKPVEPAAKVTEAPETPAKPATEVFPSKPKTDGKSLTASDGELVYEGSAVAHPTNGFGTIQKIIGGKTARVLFNNGVSKIVAPNLISSHSGVPAEPLDTSSMAPGDFAINPATGKMTIVGSDGKGMSTGDKVEVSHKGETRTGTIKGLYTGTKSIAVILDGESKPVTKKAAVSKSLEEASEPSSPEADSSAPETTEAPSNDSEDSAKTPEEAPAVADPVAPVEEAPEAPEAEETSPQEAPTPAPEEAPEEPTEVPEPEAVEAEIAPQPELVEDVAEAPVEEEAAPEEPVVEDEVVEDYKSPRVREELIDTLAPIDTSAWKNVTSEWKSEGNSTGSNPGGVFEDENGQRWYVKQSKSDAHARAETISSHLYGMTGIETPTLRLTTFNGKLGTASPMIDGAKSDLSSKLKDADYTAKVQEGFAVDAWLANWDVIGLEFDNIVTNSEGNPVRIDTGGSMMFRAQGGLKNAQQPGVWGNAVKDWESLQNVGNASKVFKGMTDQQKKESADRVASVTPEQIDAMVDEVGYTGVEADELKAILKARREDIISKADALAVAEPADLIEPVTESDRDSVESVVPETPKEPTKLTGYTIYQDNKGVYYSEEPLPGAVLYGLKNGTILPPNLPFITRKTSSGDVHYYDTNGVRHWGQYGAEGAVVRRKNAEGEYEYLMVKRGSGLSTGGGKWTVPGGAHQSQQDAFETGKTSTMELEEELGMSDLSAPVAEFTDNSTPDWAYNYAIYDAPDMDDEDFIIDEHEISDHQWLTAGEIKTLSDNGEIYESMGKVLVDIFVASESAPQGEKSAAAIATPGSTIKMNAATDTHFKKMGGNKWSMFIGDTDTGVKATNAQVQGISDAVGVDFVDASTQAPEVSPEPDAVETPTAQSNPWKAGDVIPEAKEFELDDLPIDTEIQTTGSIVYGPYMKVSQNEWETPAGSLLDSGDLADGDDYEIVSFGGSFQPPTSQNPVADSEDTFKLWEIGEELIEATKEDLDELPVGATIKVTNYNFDQLFTKISDDLGDYDGWVYTNGVKVGSSDLSDGDSYKIVSLDGSKEDQTRPTSTPEAIDLNPLEDTPVNGELDPSLTLIPGNKEIKVGDELFDPSYSELDELPVGTTISKVFLGEKLTYTKLMDALAGADSVWETHDGKKTMPVHFAQSGDFTVESVAGDTAELPVGPVGQLVDPTAEDLDNLPPGTVIQSDNGAEIKQYTKVQDTSQGAFLWENGFIQYDSDSIANGITFDVISYGDTVVEIAPDYTPETTTSFSDMTQNDFDSLAVGSKVIYTVSGVISPTEGFYQKNEKGLWQYTPAGESVALDHEIKGETFHHLFNENSALGSQFVVLGKDGSVDIDLPKGPEKSVETGVSASYQSDMLAGLPIGATVKEEKSYTSYYDTDSYFQKTADNEWTKFTKTAHKLMNHGTTTDQGLSYGVNVVSISKPLSDKHFVTYQGEIGYAGDVVTIDGKKWTVDKVLKNHINLIDSDGNKLKSAGSKVVIDPKFGVLTQHSVIDPITNLDTELKAAQKKKAEAEAAIQAELNATKNFAGASAEEYNAQNVVMPSVAAPNLYSGITYAAKGEPDVSNPLYGAPKPIEPINPSTSFSPEPIDMPKWDSAAWLEKVKQRYAANPNKVKATLEESNNWSKVQSVLAGDNSPLASLLDSKYLDSDLFEEALLGIATQDAKNQELKTQHQIKVQAAKDAYEANKAEAQATYMREKIKHAAEMEKWIAANPSTTAKSSAVMPPTSMESFTGGDADWSKAHIGTHDLKTVISSVSADKLLGTHGISVAVDSDQIEDLDVKVHRVITKSGVDSFEYKFKMTAPHGKVAEAIIGSKEGVAVGSQIFMSKVVLDPSTGLMKDTEQDSPGLYNYGKRYVYTDPETGAVVTFQRAKADGLNIDTNHNSVKIHLPIGSTEEDFQKTITNLGISNAKPSTEGDIKVLAENKLLSLMGEHSNTVKTYDGRVNMGGGERAAALKKIEETYGVTADQVILKTEPNGRVLLEFPDDVAEKLAKDYGVNYFFHHVAGDSTVSRWVSMLSGTNPGLLSTYNRFTHGIGGKGQSSEADNTNGSGDYIYLTPKKFTGSTPTAKATEHGIVVKPKSITKRLDLWANPHDGWGKKADSQKTSYSSPYTLFNEKGMPKPTDSSGMGFGEKKGSYEVLPKDSVPLADWAYVVVSQSIRDELIEQLKKSGVVSINGVPIEKFILTVGMETPVDLTEPGAA